MKKLSLYSVILSLAISQASCTDEDAPIELKLRTSVVTGIEETIATVSGKIESAMENISEVGIAYSKKPEIDGDVLYKSSPSVASEFTISLSGLKSGTTYYVRSYAKVSDAYYYGETRSFTCLGQLACMMPFVERFRGEKFLPAFWDNIDGDGDGHKWEQYDRFPSASSDSYSGGALTPNNLLVSPKITIDGTKPTLYWSVGIGDDEYPEEIYKVVVSETPFTAENCDSNGTIVFEEEMVSEGYRSLLPRQVDLSAYVGKDVYVAWVHYNCSNCYFIYITDIYLENQENPVGISTASVTLSEASDVTKNSAELEALVTDDGGATVIRKGFVYATHENPTIADEIIEIKAWNELSHKLSNLDNGVTYYVRAYAENKMGLTYSNEVSFSTPSVVKTEIVNVKFPESGALPEGWTVLDKDGDGHTWGWEEDGLWSYSYRSSWGGTLTPEDYLITPPVTIPETAEQVDLDFMIAVYKSYYQEKYRIIVSDKPITLENCQSAEVVRDWTPLTENHVSLQFQQETVDLTKFAGKTIYIGFVHGDCTDLYALVLESIKLTSYE